MHIVAAAEDDPSSSVLFCASNRVPMLPGVTLHPTRGVINTRGTVFLATCVLGLGVGVGCGGYLHAKSKKHLKSLDNLLVSPGHLWVL